jgi:DNA/RNA-binding domain of Phe-tRNA-synthetase-like protein
MFIFEKEIMKFRVDQKIFEKFPEAVIGVVVIKGADNTGDISSDTVKLLRSEEARIRESYQSETLSQDSRIDCWRKAYSAFGVKSKDARSSVEALYKMVLRGIELRKINKLVDLYNYICLKYMFPVGGEDLDKIVGDLQFTFAGAEEKPVALLGYDEPEAPKEGEVIYKDEDSTICRCWNWREAQRTILTEQTKNAVLVIEGLGTVREEIEVAAEELSQLVKNACGGESSTFIIDQNSQQIEL